MSALFFKKVSQNWIKLQQNKTNNKRPFILPKINKVYISGPNFTKSEGKVRFGHIFFENGPLDEAKKMPLSKMFCLFRKLVKNAKW